MRGELDWIVMKALEKDRARRYETASGFARDIERYLDGEAVEACPPSAGYRLRKFASRHRAALAIGLGVRGPAGPRGRAEHLAGDPGHAGRDRADREARRAIAAEGRFKEERDRAVRPAPRRGRRKPRRRPRARRPGGPRPRPVPCSDSSRTMSWPPPGPRDRGAASGRT